MVFLGRITKIIGEKIRLIGNSNKNLIIYLMPITVPDKNGKKEILILIQCRNSVIFKIILI